MDVELIGFFEQTELTGRGELLRTDLAENLPYDADILILMEGHHRIGGIV